jgi:hypothetical protein
MARHHKERPLPERARLNPPPDFIPVVQTVMEPAVHPDPVRTPYLDGPVGYYHVVVTRTEQVTCTHTGWADRFGSGECDQCGAEFWSAWWVAEGLYGLASAMDADALDGTGMWLIKERTSWERRALQATDPGR